MQLKIKIQTPTGHADKTKQTLKIKILKKIMFRKAKVLKEYSNKKKNAFIWIIETEARHYPRIIRMLGMWDGLVSGIFNSKKIQRAVKRLADSPEDYEELQDMIKRGTKVSLIKGQDEIDKEFTKI